MGGYCRFEVKVGNEGSWDLKILSFCCGLSSCIVEIYCRWVNLYFEEYVVGLCSKIVFIMFFRI